MYKLINWSYPTSTNAERFGFAEGCWTVEEQDGVNGTIKAVSGHADKADADAEAKALPHDWHPLMVRFGLVPA